ncbi:MAG: acetate--CoA ligase family protein [Smithellaceae bacterium]|jgi:acetyltransferase|nr:acetate--CoA ligase family protein [Smithellaceae bacterium]MDD3259176.1 acetate--CoA ligase family protein [Smithellaceae bacterium]
MKTFFDPASIAVIGATPRENSLGSQLLVNLSLGFTGSVYPVNPNYTEIRSLPCFPTAENIPGPVDLALVIVPAPSVPEALAACGRKGIRRVIIESAGFAETGPAGRALQERCLAVARKAGIRLWGPNCMGLVDIPRKFFFTFMHPNIHSDGLIAGRISMVVQSGMLSAGFLADLMSERAVGIAKACSIGNKMDIDECDVLEYLLEDEETDAIALYLESIVRGRRFLELADRARKPIVLLKGGKSRSGAKAALSHTSSLAGNARLQDSLLSLAGVTLARDFHQMMEVTRALAMIGHTPKRCRTAILTFSGGAGILSCDLVEQHGLSVADLSASTIKELANIFPDWMPAENPVDLFPAFAGKGALAAYVGAFNALVKDPKVDVLFMHFFVGLYPNYEKLKNFKAAADREGKVLIIWVIGRRDALRAFKREAQECGIPAHGELFRAVECLACASRCKPRKRTLSLAAAGRAKLPPKAAAVLSSCPEPIWDEYDSKRLLKICGIPTVKEKIVSSAAGAVEAAREIGFPVVLKGLAEGQVHKTESGLVRLGLSSSSEIRAAYADLAKKLKGKERILLQKQMPVEYELIAGVLRDEQFGPCVMFGLGGIFAELQKDVVFAPAPLSASTARELIGRISGKKLLQGFRGGKPLDMKIMADILVNLGNLAAACPDIGQIDVNPLVVYRGKPIAVDATVVRSEK